MPDTKHRVRLFKRERKLNLCYIFGCDYTCNLDVVETLLSGLKEKHGIGILAFKNQFSLTQSSEMCESIIPDLQMDFAIFVVHANEKRLSINEDIEGIGYQKIYRALLKVTDGRVLIVIDGDHNYKDSTEKQSTVLSRWARRKVSSQFNEEFLDGRKSFIFSWDKEHRPIHKEAMLHFFGKKGEKFFSKSKVEATVALEDPKTITSQERSKTDVGATETEGNSPANQTQKNKDLKTQSRHEQEEVSMQVPPQTDEAALHAFKFVSMPPHEQQETEEAMDTWDEIVIADYDDVPKEDTWTQPDTGASSLPEKIAILHRDMSDSHTIEDVFGNVLQGTAPITTKDPSYLKDLLLTQSVRSCFIIVEAKKIKEELQKKPHSTPYGHLLKAASCNVEKKVVVVLSKKGREMSSSEEDTITARIEEILGEKGLILWLKGNKSCLQTKRSSFSRSESCPVNGSTTQTSGIKGSSTQVPNPNNPEELVLQTRLRNGIISYGENDVKVRLERWTAPQMMTDNLFRDFHSIANAELLVYREIKTGNERTVVSKDITSQMSGLGQSLKGAFAGTVGAGAYSIGYSIGSTIGSTISLCRSSNTPSPNNDAPPSKSETDAPSSKDNTDVLNVD